MIRSPGCSSKADLAVDLQQHFAGIGVADRRLRNDFRARRGMLEGLAEIPWPAGLLGLALQVAARHVEADRVAVDAVERILDGDIFTASVQRDYQLDLVVHVLALVRIRKVLPADQQVVRVLGEKERILAIRVMPHLDRMCRIVAPDAVHPVHRKNLLRISDFQIGPRGRIEQVVFHLGVSGCLFAARLQPVQYKTIRAS